MVDIIGVTWNSIDSNETIHLIIHTQKVFFCTLKPLQDTLLGLSTMEFLDPPLTCHWTGGLNPGTFSKAFVFCLHIGTRPVDGLFWKYSSFWQPVQLECVSESLSCTSGFSRGHLNFACFTMTKAHGWSCSLQLFCLSLYSRTYLMGFSILVPTSRPTSCLVFLVSRTRTLWSLLLLELGPGISLQHGWSLIWCCRLVIITFYVFPFYW